MRIMALDVGKRRIGVAVTDPLGITARPHQTIERNKQAARQIVEMAKQLETGKILIGLPLHLDGRESEQAKDVRKFADQLKALTPIPIQFVEERLTTVEAQARLADRRGGWRKNKSRIDAVAAAIILETYLNSQ